MGWGTARPPKGQGDSAAAVAPKRPKRYGLEFSYIGAVMIGGGAGVLTRYWLDQAIPSVSGWPFATLVINLSGAWALGALLEGLHRRGSDVGLRRGLRLLLGTGFLGGFTTYSALALESVQLLAVGENAGAGLYLGISLLGGALASWFGIWCGAAWGRKTIERLAVEEAPALAERHPKNRKDRKPW